MRHDLPTKLFYYNELGDPSPHKHIGKPVDATITDITGIEDKFSLDNDGFALVHHVSNVDDFRDEKIVQTHYYPELEQLMKEV